MGMQRIKIQKDDQVLEVWPVDVPGWEKAGWEKVDGDVEKAPAGEKTLADILADPKGTKVDDAVAIIKSATKDDVETLEKILDLGTETYKGILEAVEDKLDEVDPQD